MRTTKGDAIRCFVAIEISQRVQGLLEPIQACLRSEIRKASWTKVGNFHLTLKFLGDVHPETIDGVSEVIQNVADAQAPFSIKLGGIGAFPNLIRPRVLWVGIKTGGIDCLTSGKSCEPSTEASRFSNRQSLPSASYTRTTQNSNESGAVTKTFCVNMIQLMGQS